MADIRKIKLIDGTSYEVGEILGHWGKVKNLYEMEKYFDDTIIIAFVRVYVDKKSSPHADIPLHAISIIFYS